MAKSLSYILEGTIIGDELIETANGEGKALLALLFDLKNKADAKSKAVVSARFDSVKLKGIKGELTRVSLKHFIKEYKLAKLNLDASSKPGNDSEVQMINLIAFKSPDIRDLYELN
jgi:hypothetical protein